MGFEPTTSRPVILRSTIDLHDPSVQQALWDVISQKNCNNMLKTIVVWLVAIGLPVNIILNHYYSQPLYDMGVELILYMQQFSTPLLDYLFIFFTFLIDPIFIMGSCCLFMLFMKRKIVAYSTVIFILFNTFLLTTLKAFYAAPRPYWTHSNVRNIGYYCPKDYGNPSGHAEFVAIVGCVFLLQFLDTKRQKRYGFLAVFLMITVSISRLYLGAHSLDQVIQGLFMGTSLSILYTQGGLKQFIIKLLLIKKRNYKILFIASIVIMHLLYIFGFYINHQKKIVHQDAAKIWLANYKQKCGKQIDEDYLNFLMANLSSVLVSAITGLVLGFWKASEHEQIQFFISGKWQFNKRFGWTPLAYAAYYTVEIVLFASGFIFLSPMLIALEKDNFSIFIYNSLASLASAYIYSSNAYRVHNTLQLIVPLDDGSKTKNR